MENDQPKKRLGRPPKPPGQRHVMMAFRVPPELVADVREWIPEGERTAIVVACLTKAVAKKKREAGE